MGSSERLHVEVNSIAVNPFSGKVPPVGHCWKCQYDLRGITSKYCPECGEAIDFRDAYTADRLERISAVPRGLRKAILLTPIVGLICDAMFFPLGLTIFLLLIVWIVASIPLWSKVYQLNLISRRYRIRKIDDPNLGIRRQLGIELLAVVVAVWLGLPSTLVFYPSTIWLEPVAKHYYSVLPMSTSLPSPLIFCGFGGARVTRIEPYGVYFKLGTGTFLYGTPTEAPGNREWILSNWYRCYSS